MKLLHLKKKTVHKKRSLWDHYIYKNFLQTTNIFHNEGLLAVGYLLSFIVSFGYIHVVF